MRTAVIGLVVAVLAGATPALAQIGEVNRRLGQVQKLAELNISDRDERAIGEQVSAQIRARFGVYQDAAVTKYVTLVGSVLAQASSRPAVEWTFIVLDTDGVNAYAAPGGFVHITRGALGLIRDEAELAGVLGHEIAHVTAKHTIRAIQKSRAVQLGSEEAGGSGLTGYVIGQIAERAYTMVLENEFDRDDEYESDRIAARLANKVGYAPTGLAAVLERLGERNAGRKEPNGMFASHPTLKERTTRLAKIVRDEKLAATATVEARYRQQIGFDAVPIADIVMAPDAGARGLTGGSGAAPAKKDEKADEDRKEEKGRGFGLGRMRLSSGSEGRSEQTVASAGARGTAPDRDARGGANTNIKVVTVTAAELAAFRKGIA